MEFEPDTLQQAAGLICYYNAHKFHYLNVTCDEDGNRHLAIISCLGEERFNLAYPVESSRHVPLPQHGPVWLRADVNFGAGAITCNYDGVAKHETIVGDGAFIGTNSSLVAPITVADGAYVGAGSVITKDVPAGALAVTRAQQAIKEGWAERKQKARKPKHAE